MQQQWASVFGAVGEKPQTPGADSGESARKVRAVNDSTLEKKVDVALKLSAINAQKWRLLEGAATCSLPVKVDEGLFQAMKKAHDEEYLPRVRGRKGHGLGAPDSFQFSAACMFLMPQGDEEQQKVLRQYMDNFPPGSVGAQKLVRLFRTEKMHDSKLKRLMIAIADRVLEATVVALAEKVSGIVAFTGPRPAGFLEIEAKKLLEQ